MIPPSKEPLEAQMRDLGNGHREAFDAVFKALRPSVARFCRSILQNEADAADATQEALKKVFEKAGDYEYPRPVLPWVLAIASWECRTLRRRQQRRKETQPSEGLPEATTETNTPEQHAIEREHLEAARAALGEQDERDIQVLVAAFQAEAGSQQSPAERKRKQRAIERVRSTLRRIYGVG